MDDALRREMIGLLNRIVGDKPLPSELQRTVLDLFARLAEPAVAAVGLATAAAGTVALGAGGAGAVVAERKLVYVHGICRHDTGFSNDWWTALRPFVTMFGGGNLGQSRLEVVWSDLVNQAATAFAAAARGGVAPPLGAPAGPAAVVDETARAQVAASIRETLRDRADQQELARASMGAATLGGVGGGGVMGGGGAVSLPSTPDLQMITGASGASGPLTLAGGGGGSCLDDFSVYLVHAPTRQAIIDRFTAVVRPQLAAGNEIDVISHSWGTVVAYEGLRELEDAGVSLTGVRNFFTVGAALSIGAVKLGLRSQNKDGRKPTGVRRWVNLDARGDLIGGPLQGRPYAVDEDRLNLEPFGCGSFLGAVNPSCSHSSYFQSGNDAVNRDIFARFINT